MTLEVQKAAASILREGISTTEVAEFIHQAHRKARQFDLLHRPVRCRQCLPHGVKHAQVLKDGDMVLIDTGCQVHGYQSDITRSYVFGTPSARQREFWGWSATPNWRPSRPRVWAGLRAVDAAARVRWRPTAWDRTTACLACRTAPGMASAWTSRSPYLVRGDRTPLDVGMCFSNEPMICVPGEFGIRLEDHFT